MRILKGKEHTGIIDDREHIARVGNKTYEIPPNVVISPGDSIILHGETFDVIDYNPSWFADTARRGAQIIQTKDAAYIISRAGIKPGDRVLEAGIGSGALTSALLWAIGSEGELVSVEQDVSAIERGIENIGTFHSGVSWKPVEGDIRSKALEGMFDSIILDMPDPWNAIGNAIKYLRFGGCIVTYSPTFNQTEKTVLEMEELGLGVIETTEISRRNILVRKDATRPDHQMIAHTAFMTFAIRRSGHSVKV